MKADIRKLAQGARGEDEAGYRAEFMGLIDMAAVLRPNVVPATPIDETEVAPEPEAVPVPEPVPVPEAAPVPEAVPAPEALPAPEAVPVN